MSKKLIIFLGIVVVVILGGIYFYSQNNSPAPIMETVSQEVGNGVELKDEIVVDSPKPLQEIKSPVEISGKARGNWFFEASFPAEIQDANGKTLGTGVMQAAGEWMTEDFVSFSGSIEFENPETTEGKLIIKKDNPSGLPENDKTLTIPVKF